MDSTPESSQFGMKISELAEQAGLSVDTIRFYEKRDLLREGLHFQRGKNRYRVYTEAAVMRLRLIQHGKRLGFTLNEIATEIDAFENDQMPVSAKVSRLNQKIELIDQQIEGLQQMKTYLIEKIEIVTKPKAAG